MPGPDHNSDSDLKLPSGPSARRRNPARGDDWSKLDRAETRRLIVAIVVVSFIAVAGVALILSGFRW
jgi:hypothetical protein